MKKTSLPAVFLLGLASPVWAGDLGPITFPGEKNYGIETFATPSGNVYCLFTPGYFNGHPNSNDKESGVAQLQCFRHSPTRIGVYMSESARPLMGSLDGFVDIDVSQFAVFPYGRSWRGGSFTCNSKTDGVSCTRKDGHGFHMGEAKAVKF